MSVPPEIFGEDYLHFYADLFGAERSDADAEVVARLLSIETGMRIIDVPCGEGRIAGRLARRGAEVVGIDASERFIALAREQYPEATFELGDMRSLAYDAEFDAVVNWFTSFGYFDPPTNDAVLAGFARALCPGGRLLLELHNPGHLARMLEVTGGRAGIAVERDGELMVDTVSYDEGTARSLTRRYVVRGGRVQTLEFSLEQVPAPQLVRRLRGAGFNDVRLFGRAGGPFVPAGPRLIAVARRVPEGPAPRVSLREVDAGNVRAVCELELAPGQQTYVAPSAYTLAEAAYDPQAWVRAIYADGDLAGLVAMIADTETPRYFLVRLMIDAARQHEGLGRAAVGLLAEHVRNLPGATHLETSCVPGPGGPLGFYAALVFEDTGRVEHGETVLRLAL